MGDNRKTSYAGRALALTVGAAIAGALTPTVWASPAPRTLYVGPHGKDGGTCAKSGPCRTIKRAVGIAAPGDTVVVRAGVYREDVTVTKQVAIVGVGRPVVDARGKPNGFLLSGGGADGSRVDGFKVINATFEGVLARRTSNVTIARDIVVGNDRGRNARRLVGECASGHPTSGNTSHSALAVVADLRAAGCGEAIHLLATSNSRVIGNIVTGNTGGIYLTDERGPASYNLISRNQVNDNRLDCGITLASHSNDALSKRGARQPSVAGVYANTIIRNVANRNGLALDGSGILLGAAFPGGGVYDNRILYNRASGNSHPGISIHSHAVNQDVDGNVIVGNVIGKNAVNGGPNRGPGDVLPGLRHTAGILIYSAFKPVLGTTISGNHVSDNYYGIWTRMMPLLKRRANAFRRVRIPLHQVRPVRPAFRTIAW